MSGVRYTPDNKPHVCSLPDPAEVLASSPPSTRRRTFGCPTCHLTYQLNPIVLRWFRYYPPAR